MTAPGIGDGAAFPWAWDQYQRYAVLREILAVSAPPDGRPLRVLDVGGVSPIRTGPGVWFPVRLIHNGPAVVCDIAAASGDGFVRAAGGALPFADRSFDVAAAMDVLEHVPETGRGDFLRELCRVSDGLVVLSAPFRDPGVEAVESLLFDQLRRLYGIENTLLLEHRRHGLPDPAAVSIALARDMPSGASFGFGGLTDSLVFHYFRNQFLIGKDSERVLDLLDRNLAARGASSASKPPFARMFWVYSRETDRNDLDDRVRIVLGRLARETGDSPVPPAAADLAEAIRAYQSRPMVSALVALPSGPRRLAVCLDHLLSQAPDFNFEICVWDPEENPEIRNLLAASYPDIRVLGSNAEGSTAAAFLAAADALRGDPVFLVSDRVRMPRGAAARLFAAFREAGEKTILAPRNIRRRYFDLMSKGGRSGLKKFLAGRIPNPARRRQSLAPPGADTTAAAIDLTGTYAGESPDRSSRDGGSAENIASAPTWLYSECLVFRKGDAGLRRFPAGRLSRRDIFLWTARGRGTRLSVIPDCSVSIR